LVVFISTQNQAAVQTLPASQFIRDASSNPMSSESSPDSPAAAPPVSISVNCISVGAGMKRAPSDTFFAEVSQPPDQLAGLLGSGGSSGGSPDRRLSERSKSEANLVERPSPRHRTAADSDDGDDDNVGELAGVAADGRRVGVGGGVSCGSSVGIGGGSGGGGRISEQSRVYWDLSKAGLADTDEPGRPQARKFESSLPAIRQQQEVGNQYVFSSSAESFSQCNFLRRSADNLHDAIAFVEDVEPEFDLAECLEKPGFEADRLHQLLASLDELASVAKGDGEAGGSTVVEARLAALSGVRRLLDEAWRTPRWGRDYGTALCDRLRQESLLRTLESVIGEHQLGSSQDLVLAATGLLGQALTRENIGSLGQDTVRCVVALGLQAVHTEDALACATVAVLEALLKHSAAMCSTVLKLGGLDLLLRACQARDPVLQRHCAQALANLALFGDREAHRLMAAQKVADWLFPLAFTHDQVVQYYACLAICVLAVNRELANAVASSGTLQLVRPWLLSHSPAEFRQSDEGHAQGRSAGWLQRLMTLLACDQAEAQALAAFHFAMEAVVKQEQAKAGLFADIGALPLLRRTAASTNHLAARFATQALETLGEELPHRFPAAACLWSERDVQLWLQQVGFPELVDRFSRSRVDGDLLLRITDADLRDSIGLSNGLLRQRLMREIDQLRTSTDYSPCDPSGLAGWLRRCVGQDSVQFAYALLTAGCDRRLLASASDAMLADAGVSGAVHRLRILRAASRQPEPAPGPDVFVSYRREGGALLASLLRVHLQLRGHTVFLDVYRLPSGRFDDQLLHSIANTRNFIVVLTPGALDRCIGDNDGADWLHKELSVALSSGCNIIPVLDPGFVFPDPDQLPEDIRCLQAYNSVPWKHEYQDACIAKIESFLVKASAAGAGAASDQQQPDSRASVPRD
ncbi:hypothetical protein BOX15_Mlig026056g1, partial [Macrostomum lignano]